jgi:hypothetical protein
MTGGESGRALDTLGGQADGLGGEVLDAAQRGSLVAAEGEPVALEEACKLHSPIRATTLAS